MAELSLALHYVFNTPDDKIIFDVGHQVRCAVVRGVRWGGVGVRGVCEEANGGWGDEEGVQFKTLKTLKTLKP